MQLIRAFVGCVQIITDLVDIALLIYTSRSSNLSLSCNLSMQGSRIFFQGGGGGGGGGGPGPTARKQSGQFFFYIFLYFFYSPQLILQFTEGVQLFCYRENYTLGSKC